MTEFVPLKSLSHSLSLSLSLSLSSHTHTHTPVMIVSVQPKSLPIPPPLSPTWSDFCVLSEEIPSIRDTFPAGSSFKY